MDDTAHSAQCHTHPSYIAQRTGGTTGDTVFHCFHADLTRGFLLVGIAFHPHFGSFRFGFHTVGIRFRLTLNTQCFGIPLRTDDLHPRFGLCFHCLALGGCRGFGLTDFFLPHQQILLGVLLLHLAEIRVIVRGDYAADVKLRHGQAVVRKACIDALF